ncbi:MAG: hypothetical protein WAV31_04440 [Candidatus Moraniibacteriota bacterium]
MKKDNQEIIIKIEKIKREYLTQISKLKSEQNEIINEFIQRLEEKKKENILKKIKQ